MRKDYLTTWIIAAGLLLFAYWLASVTGCALGPQTVGPFVQHDSHLAQHFGSERTDYGANLIGINARWIRGGWYADVSEAVNVQGARPGGYGEIDGGRECFEARVGYAWSPAPR